MNISTETKASPLDTIKLLLALAVVIGAAFGFHIYKDKSLFLSSVGMVAAIGVAVAIALTTLKGKMAWGFVKDARLEVRKVVWPTRQETIQTTIVVFVAVLIVGIILWLMDTILFKLIGWLTGQG